MGIGFLESVLVHYCIFPDNSETLQLRGRRQIAEPRKYCLVHVLFSLACVFSICFVSHRLGFWLNSLQLVSEPKVKV